MPGTVTPGTLRGFSGKVPARGDFVHGGLPRDFIDPWHDWQSLVIAGSRTLMGDGWLEAFLEAPVWRFILPPGRCGTRAAVGLIMPSVDKVGRYFPLTLAALPESGTPIADDWSAWLESVETMGRLALDEDAPPERLMPPPPPVSATATGSATSLWWTDGGPRVAASHLALPALPDALCFASMLGHLAPTESAP
jgi:type VI secretion system protein ImpM